MLRNQLGGEAAARFQVLGALGTGGFGAVYEAVDRRTQQRLALKELDNTSGDAIARFKHEFRALADCHHPNLVGLYELIEQNGRYLIVMELVPGSDLGEYIRGDADETVIGGGPRYDEGRLRSALSGVLEGLKALHTFGILHRDLKPSNVRVRPDGRAVLLDFGLATSTNPKQQSTHAMAVGTVHYMAPEQASGKPLSPATDLYALGVCLFEALTGRPPFDGETAVSILLAKQQQEAPRASSINRKVPPDLDELCAQLLALDAGARPSADAVLLALGGEGSRRGSAPTPSLATPELLFAGRERELEHLERALAATERGELRVVLVEGESGVGKSELVAEFLRKSAARHPKMLALRGRCYENEHVPYKAFDGCIDELSKYLRRLSDADCSALLPLRATLLAQIFPVLKNIKSIAKAPRDGVAADLTARRLEAFEALASLLAKLAEDRPLALLVDDLQWADGESFRMLQALAERPQPPALLLVATVRPREELEPDVLAHVNGVRTWNKTDVVPLFGLPREQARALAARLMGDKAPGGWLDVIAEQSEGHPLFLSELVQFTRSHDLASRGSLTLDAALRSRIDRLDRDVRDLLEVVALAGRPHGATIFARALSVATIDEPARSLLASKLLRLRRGQELGCYHDRIRHTVSELVGAGRRIAIHRRIAMAIGEEESGDPAEQAHHWDLAGDVDRAVDAYTLAVKRASESLAFARAAQLAARAIELVDNSGDPRAQALSVARAEALGCAGHSAAAAALFQAAADRAEGEARIRLRSNAAHYLMLGGRTAEGVRAGRELLIELGFKVPLGTLAALLGFLWGHLVFRLRKEIRKPLALPSGAEADAERLRFDVLNEQSIALALVHPLALLSLRLQSLRLAQRSGRLADAALALTGYGWLLTVTRDLNAALPLFERSLKELREQNAEPSFFARQAYSEGSARLAGFDWRGAAECMERAQELLRAHCPDTPQMITYTRYHLGAAWYHTGETLRLARDSELWLAEVRERNDVLGEALLVGIGQCFVRHLMRDDPDAALAEIERVQGAISPEPFSFAHFGLFLARVFTHFYQGGPAALRFIESFEPQRKRAGMFKTALGKEAHRLVQCQAALHACVAASPKERARLLKQVRGWSRRLGARSPLTQAFKQLISAQLEGLAGSRQRALQEARSAKLQLEAIHHTTTSSAQLLVRLLEDGADAGMTEHEDRARRGWANPARAHAISLPTLPLFFEAKSSKAKARTNLLLGRYEVLDAIDGGSSSMVRARDVQSGRELALKELVRSSGTPLERFKREFRALQGVHHPNLAGLEALLEHDGRWYIAMELVPGSDLTTYVRSGGSCNATRVRSTFASIARGLLALHEAGFVHRDLTPRHLRVTPEGRAVVLDFGIIAREGDAAEATSVGSPEYAAPEQLTGALPSAQADVYALGVCLYECLFGQVPSAAGAAVEVGARRTSGLRLESAEKDVTELAALCRRMLSALPEQRPTMREVVLALDEPALEESASRRAADRALEAHTLPFSGREQELAQLRAAFERTCDDGLTFAFVEGESGVGKSALVQRFAEGLTRAWPSLIVLSGRCYENEQLPYKAFDGAVDRLATLLRSMPNPHCEALLPKRAALLAQLFPVLTSVPAIAQASSKGLPADPAAQKRAAWECFFELLANLSERQELLFVIDDVQWADAESFALLRALHQRRAELPLLFLCTVRSQSEVKSRAEIAELRTLPGSEQIALEGLTEAAARALALELYETAPTEERLATVVRESRGHPLFLRELIAHERRGSTEPRAALTLESALSAHIASLSEMAQKLLCMAALAERPLALHVFERALAGGGSLREDVIGMLANGLLRRRGASEIACFHDRIRSVALALLAPETRRALARSLAVTLEEARLGEPAERARLWEEAADGPRAIAAFELAGDRALASLAFTQAEEHYARALTLLVNGGASEPERARRILEQRGHALVRAGRSADAASCFQRAAASADGEAQVQLRILAAQHLIQSAQLEEGLAAAEGLLRELELPLPASERGALTQIAWERMRIKVRGLKLSRNNRLNERERLRLAALHGLSAPVRAVSYLPGSALVLQYLRRALAAGEPVHSARALAFEALFRTTNAPTRDLSSLFEQSREFAIESGEPALIAEVELLRGLAYIAQSRLTLALPHLSSAHEVLQTRCPGEPFLLTTVRMYLGYAWFYNADMSALIRHSETWIDEARAREDRYAYAALSGFGCGSVRHLVADAGEQARSELERAIEPWPEQYFSTIHVGTFGGHAYALGYDRPAEGLAFLDRRREARARAYLMRTAACRLSEQVMTLEALMRTIPSAPNDERGTLLARAEAAVTTLRATRSDFVRAQACLFSGVVKLARGDRDGALADFTQSAERLGPFAERHAYAPTYYAAALRGGEGGRGTCRELTDKLRAHGWKNIDRALALQVPGVGLLG